MTTITLNISDNNDNRILSREEGEMLVRETFLPAYKDVLKAEKEGISFPDAHEILNLLDD